MAATIKIPEDIASDTLFQLGVILGMISDEFGDGFDWFFIKSSEWEQWRQELLPLLQEESDKIQVIEE